MAVKPWLGAIKAPSKFIKPEVNSEKAPKLKLTLEHVFGYRSKDCRNNIKILPDNKILYNTAGLAIIHENTNNTNQ
jgi:HELP motif